MGRQSKAQRNRKKKLKPEQQSTLSSTTTQKTQRSSKPTGLNPPEEFRPIGGFDRNGGPSLQTAGGTDRLRAVQERMSKQGRTPPSAEQVQAANDTMQQLQKLLEIVSSEPKSLLSVLDDAGVAWTRIKNVPGDDQYDTIVIAIKDLRAGDAFVASRGSLYKQVYGIEFKERLSREGRVPNHNNQ